MPGVVTGVCEEELKLSFSFSHDLYLNNRLGRLSRTPMAMHPSIYDNDMSHDH
jgi:hypothetical protein